MAAGLRMKNDGCTCLCISNTERLGAAAQLCWAAVSTATPVSIAPGWSWGLSGCQQLPYAFGQLSALRKLNRKVADAPGLA